MEQPPLFRMAPDAMSITAQYDWRSGWRLVVQIRRSGESWDSGYRCTYEALDTSELQQVIEAELERELGPDDA